MVGLDGLASGLPTAELIASLVAFDAKSQTLIKNKVTSNTTVVTALQALNAKIAALGVLAAKSGKPTDLDFLTATSSAPGVTATASAGATAGQLDVVVGALAQSQSGVTAAKTAWSGSVITIVGADGTPTELTASSSSLDDIVRAVNTSATGVTATKIASGVDGGGVPQYRLQFSGRETGAANSFTVLEGTAATGTDVLAQPGAATIRAAADASVTLWAGTPAEQVLTSKSNTFSNLLPGVAITVSAVSATPVTVTVAPDTAKTTASVKDLIASLNETIAYISTRTVAVASTDSAGNAMTSGGVFTGDSTVRDATQKMLEAASAPINGISPSEYGISITKTGTMEFDPDKFAAALAKNPALAQGAVAVISTRLAEAAKQISDKSVGTITAKITGQESTIKSLKEQVSKWDDRLAQRKTNLERMYSAFEVRMSNLNSQMTWLTSQVDALQAQKD